MMVLSKTSGGNWAKESQIGSKWKKVSIHATREAAESACQVRQSVVPITAERKLVDRLGVADGATVYMVAVPAKRRAVLQHASRAECEAAGLTPGPCNV